MLQILCHEYMLHSEENQTKPARFGWKEGLLAAGTVQRPGCHLVKGVKEPTSQSPQGSPSCPDSGLMEGMVEIN